MDSGEKISKFEGNNLKPFSNKDNYNDKQWIMWKIFADMCNSMEFGYIRMPTPGEDINLLDVQGHIGKIVFEWSKEWHNRDRKSEYDGIPDFLNMDELSKQYLSYSLKNAHSQKRSEAIWKD